MYLVFGLAEMPTTVGVQVTLDEFPDFPGPEKTDGEGNNGKRRLLKTKIAVSFKIRSPSYYFPNGNRGTQGEGKGHPESVIFKICDYNPKQKLYAI